MMISARFSQPPSQSEGALLYRRGLQTMDTVRQAIASLEVQSDLCAAPGHLVVANFGTVESDNEKRPAGWGLGSEEFVWKKATHYPVILEAKLEFNPKTGAAKSFNAGFAKHSVMSFEQSGDVQRFQQTKEDEKGGYLIVDRAANGDLHVQSFASTRQETLDQKARQAEQSAPRRGFFSRFIFG